MKIQNSLRWVILIVGVTALLSIVAVNPIAAHGEADDGHIGTANTTCGFAHPEWRSAQTIDGIRLQESQHCRPDNPYRVAAAVEGTNNVGMETLMKSGLNRNAVVKKNDRDGDGDPDEIHITLEITGVNEYNATNTEQIAPGVEPAMWTFSPKTRGMVDAGSKADAAIKTMSPPLRVEEGDTVYVTVENTHYMPHTIHFHGVDHPYEANGSGNDGVPQTGERPIQPGDERTYEFTPREAGTMFYHCHVVPNVHVEMGLNGQFIIEENRSNNTVQTFNFGGGKVRHPSKAVREEYAAEYDLHYQSLDKTLSEIPQKYNEPRTIARTINREYDATDETADYFLLNGRSYPYTVQESQLIVEPDKEYKLHVSNAGPGTVSLHTHGHKVNITATDGVDVPAGQQTKRDVVQISPAQRLTLRLDTTDDGVNSYGPGVWFTHDHREKAITTDGISPGGGITTITYERYLNGSTGMPRTPTNLTRYFNTSYYDGEIPYFTDETFSPSSPETIIPDAVRHGAHIRHNDEMDGMMAMTMVDDGTIVNENTETLPYGCTNVQGNKHVTIKAGTEYADEGEMFGFSTDTITAEPCTRVTVTLENHDDVRHQWMIHGLPEATYPMKMFNLEARANGTVTGTFITPSFEQSLLVHCSLPQHEQKGMHGRLVIGSPADPTQDTSDTAQDAPAAASARQRGSSLLLPFSIGTGVCIGVILSLWRLSGS
ncbi:multicopper oxidase domain-containing protein [Natrinema sp. 1APR25-10V2]|uniref:multicopper oxidase domain-containing protein n=1 Tax=Natrinema sp. 1APR25-10V2 TaxID=2951081 RepID=UPI002875AD11|nr:multicopper oxidase domain-containing protein [Natrinema sp. 1APR25-10V2]MDS0477055.1 multicopper oxidase domain-containing protein [Natrinema sp. 1APR25-10V2]